MKRAVIFTFIFFCVVSCLLKKSGEQGQVKDNASVGQFRAVESSLMRAPEGCQQLKLIKNLAKYEDFYKNDRDLLDQEIKGMPRLFSYKQQECHMQIRADEEALSFMDERNISCTTESNGSLILNFPKSKDEKYKQVKIPCDTKELIIEKWASAMQIYIHTLKSGMAFGDHVGDHFSDSIFPLLKSLCTSWIA